MKVAYIFSYTSFPDGSVVKNQPSNAADTGSVPESGRSSGVGNGNPPQYSCLENSIEETDRLQSMESQRVGHDSASEHTHIS